MNLKETYNRIAENWHRDHSTDVWWHEGTNVFISLLPPGGRVLDVGCGSGVKSKYLVDHGFKVVGIDIADKLLEIAKREVPQGEFREFSMTNLSLLRGQFDGVFAQASLLHIPKNVAGDVVQKMAERLMPEGLLYVAVKETREGNSDEEILKENGYGYEYERFFSYFTMSELEQHFARAGLEVVVQLRNPSPSGNTVWLQIIGKRW